MCGIAGIFSQALMGQLGHAGTCKVLLDMTDAIKHRGPDSVGHWIDVADGVALGHRRLSIVDLSETESLR